uniref:Lipase domain-containing protein n=1 Tax=Romanomermis culicivorax TaxID=13658 RepID=A0A915KZT5_ROMCU
MTAKCKTVGSFLFSFSLLLFFRRSYCSLIQDYDKCTLWLKTDGSSCQASTYFSIQNWALSFVPSFSSRKVCCKDGTGCFSIDKDTPYECYNDLPSCMDVVKPKFYFYTPERNQDVQMIDYFNLEDSVEQLEVAQPSKPFFAIVHGFGSDWPKPWMFNMKDKLNDLDNNVLIVRWTEGAKDPWYFKASANTRTVGAALARVVNALNAAGKISISTSTIVGFSLGGQIAGHAGSNIPKLARIIALDPAGPNFQCMHPKARLDSTDAIFVQAIHTHGEYFVFGGCGTLQQFGDMDVYMNGGVTQPGCGRGLSQALTEFISFMVEAMSCSHNRVPKLFTEMVANAKNPENSCNFTAFPCTSTEEWLSGNCFQCPESGCPSVGYLAGTNNVGKFYVNTLGDNTTSGGYCGRQYLLSLITDKFVKGRIVVELKNQTFEAKPIMLQDTNDVIIANSEKSIVATVPYHMTEIVEVELIYNRHQATTGGGPPSFKILSLSVQSVDGRRVTNTTGVTIKDSETKRIMLPKNE